MSPKKERDNGKKKEGRDIENTDIWFKNYPLDWLICLEEEIRRNKK